MYRQPQESTPVDLFVFMMRFLVSCVIIHQIKIWKNQSLVAR